jgi:2-methylcitrate dehydratase
MTFVERLAQWIVEFDGAALPQDVRQRAKLLLLDAIGCALAAADEDTGQAAIRTAAALGGTPECRVIGTDLRTSVAGAILANGALIRTLDMNDLYNGKRTNGGHPSDNMAVALAFGERQDASGREILAAIVLGYEIFGRIKDLSDADTAWDSTCLTRIVAPAMAGRLLRLPPAALAAALGLSIALGPSLGIARKDDVTAAKSVTDALMAWGSAAATLLAAEGLTGPLAAVEGPSGWTEATGMDLAAILAPPGPDYRIMESSVKAFPCVGTAQTPVAAAIEARAALGGDTGSIEHVEVRMADVPMVQRQVIDEARRHPRLRETADHSFFFLVAAALLDGELTARQFELDRWLQPEVLALMDRIEVGVDPALNRYTPGSFPCRLRVSRSAGPDIEITCPYAPGNPKNPMTLEQVEAKFRYATARLPGRAWEAVVDGVMRLDERDSIRPIMHRLSMGAAS